MFFCNPVSHILHTGSVTNPYKIDFKNILVFTSAGCMYTPEGIILFCFPCTCVFCKARAQHDCVFLYWNFEYSLNSHRTLCHLSLNFYLKTILLKWAFSDAFPKFQNVDRFYIKTVANVIFIALCTVNKVLTFVYTYLIESMYAWMLHSTYKRLHLLTCTFSVSDSK